MCESMADIQSATADIRRGKKKELDTWANANVMAALLNIGGALCYAAVWLTPTTRLPRRETG